MIRTYLMDVEPLLRPEVYKSCYDSMPDFRKEKADRIKTVSGKAQSIGAWYLYEQAKQAAGVGAAAVFNLAHSGHYALCVIDDTTDERIKAGCDVEMIQELRISVAKRFFTPHEYAHISGAGSEEERTWLFYRYWVLKESFMKATRRGMRLDTRNFEIRFDAENSPWLAEQPEEFADTYYYKEYIPEKMDALIAVCTTEKCIATKIEVISL